MNIIKKILTSGNFFATKDLPLIEKLTTYLFVKKIKKKEILLQEGQINDKIYYLQKGLLRVYIIHEGKEINTWFVKEGEFINSVTSFYYETPSEEYIEAIEDCEVLEIKKTTYNMLLRNNLKLDLFVIDQLYINLCEYHDQCQSLRFLTAKKNTNFYLLKKLIF